MKQHSSKVNENDGEEDEILKLTKKKGDGAGGGADITPAFVLELLVYLS